MTILVQKFGGTSVADIDCLRRVADIVIEARQQGNQIVVVVSAMAGETDRLISLSRQAVAFPNLREYDVLVSTGEQVSMALLSMMLAAQGYPARSYNGLQAGICTDTQHKKAHIIEVDVSHIQSDLDSGYIAVVAGFQGCTATGDITTLGRGGSDTTAVALAAALQAQECQIYTDVEGVYTADPNIIPEARCLSHITFEEMLEMSGLGAKVLQNRAVRYAGRFQVPLRVLSSFAKGEGTLITYEDSTMEQPIVSGLAFNRSEAKITITGLIDQVGCISQLIKPLADAHIDIDMIIQSAVHEGKFNLTFTVSREDYETALKLMENIAHELKAKVIGDNKIAKLSIIGVGMRSHTGVANRMFDILAQEGIMIEAVATSEIKISVIINEKYLELAARALHIAFGLEKEAKEDFDPAIVL